MSAFDGFNSHSYYIFRTLIARSAIIFIALVVRFLCKLSKKEKGFGWDDFWILVAFCLNYIGEGLTFWGLFRSKGGLSTAVLLRQGNREGVEDYLLATDIGAAIWHLCVGCICWSIICFYLRIFRFETHFVRNSWILFVFSGTWAIGCALGSFFICIPASNFWKMKDLDKCGSYSVFILASSILEILITIAILAMPARPVLKLGLSLRTRLMVLGVFLLGGFTIVSSIIRVAIIYKPGQKSPDYHQIFIWSGIHVTAAFTCACLPMCRPVWAVLSGAFKNVFHYSRDIIVNRLRSSHSRQTLGSDRSSSGKSSESLRRRGNGIEQLGKSSDDAMVQEHEVLNGQQPIGSAI